MARQKHARSILAANVRRLMAHMHSPQRFLEQSGSNATIGRILRLEGRYGASLENIQRIADHFNLEPWQLLVEGLDPERPPELRDVREPRVSRAKQLLVALTTAAALAYATTMTQPTDEFHITTAPVIDAGTDTHPFPASPNLNRALTRTPRGIA